MLKHVVMWKIKEKAENKTKDEIMKIMKTDLEDLKNKIKEINKIEVGINIITGETAFDLVLYSEFENQEALEKYLEHPEHKKIADFIGKVRESRYAVDYLV